MAIMYHVTPYETWIDRIKNDGLALRSEKRGHYADADAPRIYLFEDEDTAEDGLSNWLIDYFPTVRWFALLEVAAPDQWIHDDPEIAGSYYVEHPIPPEAIRLVRKIDGGEPDE